MNLTMVNGCVSPGSYGCLDLSGDTQIEDDVTFDVMLAHGRVSAGRLRGHVLQIDGMLRSSGPIDVGTVGGSGSIEAYGGIRTRRMEFVGDVTVRERIRVIEGLAVSGMLSTDGPVSAQSIAVEGVLDGRDVNAIDGVCIMPLETMMLSWDCFRRFDRPSTADNIRCGTLDAKNLHCQSVTARTVDLRGTSDVDSIRCRDTLSMGRQSVARHVSGGCERVALNG